MRWRPIDLLRSATLRTRLTLWNAAVVLLLLAVTLVVVRISARATLYEDADAELRAASGEIALAIQELGDNEVAIVGELRRKADSHEQRGWFMQMLTADGRTVWKSEHCPADVANFPPADVDRVVTVRQVGHYRFVRTRVDRPTGAAYLVRVGTYTTGLDESLATLMRILGLVGGGLALAAPLVAWWLAGRATRPIATMLRTAGRLSPTRLGDRLPVRGSSDELDLLANTINGLLDSVAGHIDRQEQFVADAAHELRGPLAALQSSLEVTIGQEQLPDDQRESLTDMLEATRHLSKVANDLLLLAESGAAVKPGDLTTVDVAGLVRQTAAMFSGVAEERGLVLRVETSQPAHSRANPIDLRRLLSNLVDNAIRFTPREGSIDIRVAPAGAATILTIADTGAGIAAQDLEHVFDRFYKADPARTHGAGGRSGGLGLSICRSIVESCGGTIGIASRVGEGTVVTVRLPATEQAATPPVDLARAGRT